MSSDNPAPKYFNLKIYVDPDVHIRVLDSHSEVIAEAFGNSEHHLPAGRYTVEAEQHGIVGRKSVWLTPKHPDTELTKSDFNLTYRSAAPLANVRRGRTEREHPEHSAAQLSTSAPKLVKGHGAEIFVFVRSADVASRKNPARDIRLFSSFGKELVNFERTDEFTVVGPEQSWAAIILTVDPGNYILRTSSGARYYDRTIPASTSFQTRVFLNYSRTDRTNWGIDPADVSVLAGPLSTSFNPTDEHSQMADLMLRALEYGAFDLDGRIVRAAMKEKIEDPMLGIYLGIYLASSIELQDQRYRRYEEAQVTSAERDRALSQIELILQNVYPFFADASDLQILDAWYSLFTTDSASSAEPLEAPPMLAASWSLARKVEANGHTLVPPNTPVYQTTLASLAAGPWFTWWPLQKWQLERKRSSKEITDKYASKFLDAVRMIDERQRTFSSSFELFEDLQASPDESLSAIFDRVQVAQSTPTPETFSFGLEPDRKLW